ncbi:hypothetical protein [Geovibrio ferrireducens]|uniref:hypothetical protein n=1 Tax=Geovibrio ferrireducens TaxID=46201 RepID=UPI0022468DA3|nr:hypothetical protein [Geovibrio ferrireducens]
MERRDCELTFDERKALETEVFSKLCCPGWIIRFLKLVIPSLALVISCTTAAPVQQAAVTQKNLFTGSSYIQELKAELHASDSTAEFEAAMPQSGLLLGALVSFDKKKHQG